MSPTTRTCESFEAVLSLSYFFAGAQCLYLQYSSSFCDRSVPAFQRCAKQTSPGCSMRNVCISHHVLLHAVPVFRLSAINHGVLCQRAIVSHRVLFHAIAYTGVFPPGRHRPLPYCSKVLRRGGPTGLLHTLAQVWQGHRASHSPARLIACHPQSHYGDGAHRRPDAPGGERVSD